MSDERVRVDASGVVHVDGEPYAMTWRRASDATPRLASLLRAGLAAEEAPEGLWPGPVVDGRQTYYGEARDMFPGWFYRYFSSTVEWFDEYAGPTEDPTVIVQCRPPAPQPVIEDVPLARVVGRWLPGAGWPVVRVEAAIDGWACRGHGSPWQPLPLNDDGTVTVLAEGGAS